MVEFQSFLSMPPHSFCSFGRRKPRIGEDVAFGCGPCLSSTSLPTMLDQLSASTRRSTLQVIGIFFAMTTATSILATLIRTRQGTVCDIPHPVCDREISWNDMRLTPMLWSAHQAPHLTLNSVRPISKPISYLIRPESM